MSVFPVSAVSCEDIYLFDATGTLWYEYYPLSGALRWMKVLIRQRKAVVNKWTRPARIRLGRNLSGGASENRSTSTSSL
ncbi:hypothetical protein PRIPAC_96301 [Pristionchus pacificus]|uniref:Uncharacterized protein n=1 Tax=Pristionchus pacificus TaxID=54126 RepID=A0A2A6D1M5_PRIPA|nr:hypothetical protein PRIPAC_96301 [Pristionchus pacificus]|eukprot:PDM84289.1 hypothetical protein PRIPAC_33312 [Pristionchus pacificus]